MRTAREAAGLTIEEAASEAGMSPTTWGKVEKGDEGVRRLTYAGIERVLGWKSGSTEQVLAGHAPVQVGPPIQKQSGRPRRVDLITEWENRGIAEIEASGAPQVVKDELMAIVRTKAAEARIAEDRIRNATAS